MSADRFLITGALGCIGAWTVRNLVREGVPTVVFDLGRDPHRLKLITFAEPGFPSPEEFDAGPLVELIGPLPRTPLPEAVVATIALFREKVANGEMAADALLR